MKMMVNTIEMIVRTNADIITIILREFSSDNIFVLILFR